MQKNTRRWVRRIACSALALAVVTAGVGVYLLRRPPAVWRETQALIAQSSPEQQARTSQGVIDRIEQQIAGAGHDIIDETFELRLTNEELVAVVGETFETWALQRGYEVPTHITAPLIVARDGELAIAFQVSTSSWQQVFSGYVDLRFDRDGMALGRVDELTAGSLPISVAAVGQMLKDQLPASEEHLAETIGHWLAELEGFRFRPVLELKQRRRARVVSLVVGDGSVNVTMRVQDHLTYKQHNALMDAGTLAVTDPLRPELPGGSAIADVPTATD